MSAIFCFSKREEDKHWICPCAGDTELIVRVSIKEEKKISLSLKLYCTLPKMTSLLRSARIFASFRSISAISKCVVFPTSNVRPSIIKSTNYFTGRLVWVILHFSWEVTTHHARRFIVFYFVNSPIILFAYIVPSSRHLLAPNLTFVI